MKDRLIAALKQLEPVNPNHWTAEGLPRLETIRILVGDQSVTRADLVDVAPAFSRTNQAIGPVETAPVVTPGSLGISDIVHVEDEEVLPEGVTDEEELAFLTEEIGQLQVARDKLNVLLSEKEARRDQIQMKVDAKAPANKLSVQVQSYHERQLELRNARVAARKTLQESGVNLKELAKMTQGAPIDTARQRR